MKGATVIELLNHLVDEMETYLSDDVDVDGLAGAVGTTDYHVGRCVLVRFVSDRCEIWIQLDRLSKSWPGLPEKTPDVSSVVIWTAKTRQGMTKMVARCYH